MSCQRLVLVAGLAALLTVPIFVFAAESETGLPPSFQLSDVTIQFSRTSCFGTCPEYRLAIHGAGACTFTGIKYTRQTGDVNFHLDQTAVVELLNDLYRIDFFGMRDKYLTRSFVRLSPSGELQHLFTMAADEPHLILTIQIGSYSKAVEANSQFGPKELLELGDKIDRLTNSSQWVKVLSDQPKR